MKNPLVGGILVIGEDFVALLSRRNDVVAHSADQLAESIDRWAGPLRAWLRVRSANSDDIVQESFCRLAQQSSPPERIAPWLFRVAKNLVREEYRQSARRQKRETLAATTEQQGHSASQSLEDEELRAAVEALPAELREVVIARLWGELTLAEISEISKISIATVHRRYEQAIASLRSKFAEPHPVAGTKHVRHIRSI